MKRMVVLSVVCMMLAAATVGLAGCPVTAGGWPVLEIGREYLFRSSADNVLRATVVSQAGQWVTATDYTGSPSLVNLENVFDIRD
ncbi:MAG: hypothetical protein GX580_13975 [Candidatus Hydrogenedens sp.]|nr:hypothetical protein [Candidatus Hydrogenedens sp.]